MTAGDRELRATWTAPAGVDVARYEVQSKLKSTANWPGTDIDVVGGTSHTFTGLTNGSTYQVRVRTVETGQQTPGNWSAPAEGTPRPKVSLPRYTPILIWEGVSVTVTARLSSALSSQVVIPVTITDDTAEPDDHGPLTSITIASGATSGTGTITTNHDADDVDEIFTVSLGTLPTAVTAGWPSSVQVQILDDDRIPDKRPQVTLKVKPNPVNEGALVMVTAKLTAALAGNVTIPVTVTRGTSEADDHETTLESITIGAGATSGTGTIMTAQDDDFEDETFTVALGALPASVTAGSPASVAVTILDLDEPSRVSLQADEAVSEGSPVRVTAFVSDGQPNPVTIPLTVTRGTSEEDDHGTLASITIRANRCCQVARIETFADADDDDETFTVALDAANLPAGLVAGDPDSVEVTIKDGGDDDDGGGGGGGGGPGGGGGGPGGGGGGPGAGGGGGAAPTQSSDASLSGLLISAGSLAFDSATTSYEVTVAHAVERVRLTPTVNHAGATVTVNGATVNSGSPSAAVALDEGANTITVRVTAENGTTQDYTVTVTRQAAARSSNANLGGLTASSNTRASGTFAALALRPSFSAARTSYAATVADTITHVKLTPTVQDTGKATVAVDGSTVRSGSPSAAIALREGANAIGVRVTAEDGTRKDYVVTVTRQAAARSSNANLSGLTAGSNTRASGTFAALALRPSFSAARTSYAATVAGTITHVKLTPTVQDTGKATVAVNGSTVRSGSPSAAIALREGANPIGVRVTAENGTTKNYTVTVTRQAADTGGSTQSSDASLSGLLVSAGTLTPSFSAATTSYAVAVEHTVESVKLTPTVNHAGATVTVNGAEVASGSPSGSISLSVGENPIEVVVTAEDGTTRTYRVTVTRAEKTQEKTLGAEEKALVDKVGQALLGRDDPGEYPAEGASNR